MSLLAAFTAAVLPILSVAAVGYPRATIGHRCRAGQHVGLYVLVPVLTFHSLVTTALPAVGFALAGLLAFPNVTTAAVFVVECGPPAAVIPLSLTIEYGGAGDAGTDPATDLSTVIFVTTIASVPVLTLLIASFQGGLF